jgi:hypothetical protein
MLRALILASLLLLPSGLWAAEEIKKDTIGPWEIEATFKNDKFDHCAISRSVDDVVARFVRTTEDLTLVLESPNWKLERGKEYPVRIKAGTVSWNANVASEASSVSVPIKDRKFKEALRAANMLNVEGAGSTIHVPLDQSFAALGRLDQCVEKNGRAVETNPFVAPKRQP